MIDCPHCGKSTQLYLNLSEFVNPNKPKQPKKIRFGWLYVIGGIVAAIILAYFFGEKIGNYIDEIFPIVGGAVGGLIFLAVFIFFLILAIFWIIFPWMVYSMLKSLRDELKRIEVNTRRKD